MATTLFDLEGKVTMNATDFFTTASSVSTQLDTIATTIGNIETSVSNLRISQILDSTTFTAEKIVVTKGLDELATKVSTLKDAFSAIDLGGTLLSTLGGGLASLAGNLLIGDIKVGLDTPSNEDISAEITAITTYIEGLGGATISVTLPDASVDPLSSEITTAGNGIAAALETATEWEFPIPNMPSIESTRAKIRAFWSFVKSGLNLSVDAFVNVHMNQIGGVTGIPQGYSGEWTGGGGASGSSNWFDDIGAGFEAFGSWANDTAWAVSDFLTENITNPVRNFFGLATAEANGNPYIPTDNYPALLHRGERVLTRQQNEDYTSNRATSNAADLLPEMEKAVFSALSRWASPVGGEALAAMMTPRVDSGIANNTRGVR